MWSGKYVEQTSVCPEYGIKWETFDSYASVLEGLSLYDKVAPWLARDYERAARRPKCFMRDSGLLSALLKWDENEVINDRDCAGKLVESFIYHELASLVDSGGHYEIFHYRDRDKREVDFVVRDTDSGHILTIDAKSGTNVSRDDFRQIRSFLEHMTKGAPRTGIVPYSGRDVLSLVSGLYAVPTAMLRER